MIERRGTQGGSVEFRRNGLARIRGYAARFGVTTTIAAQFRERIHEGAFRRALVESSVPFLINHRGAPVARSTSGTLRLAEDERGLHFEADLDTRDPDAMALVTKLQRRDLEEMSFAFSVRGGGQKWIDEKGEVLPLRIITDIATLHDIAAVTAAAYPETSVAVVA